MPLGGALAFFCEFESRTFDVILRVDEPFFDQHIDRGFVVFYFVFENSGPFQFNLFIIKLRDPTPGNLLTIQCLQITRPERAYLRPIAFRISRDSAQQPTRVDSFTLPTGILVKVLVFAYPIPEVQIYSDFLRTHFPPLLSPRTKFGLVPQTVFQIIFP